MEIAASLDKLIKDRGIPELAPEEMGMLQKDYQEFHKKRIEDRIAKKHKNEASEMEEKHSVKKTVALETDEKERYKLFE